MNLSKRAKQRLDDAAIVGDACVNWPGAKVGQTDYGEAWASGRKVRAHRLSYEYHKGPIPDGQVIRHTCDNPTCINPAHLLAGTQAQNIQDAAARKRMKGRPKLTADDVQEIRQMITAGVPNKDIALLFNCGRHNISKIKRGKSWN